MSCLENTILRVFGENFKSSSYYRFRIQRKIKIDFVKNHCFVNFTFFSIIKTFNKVKTFNR